MNFKILAFVIFILFNSQTLNAGNFGVGQFVVDMMIHNLPWQMGFELAQNLALEAGRIWDEEEKKTSGEDWLDGFYQADNDAKQLSQFWQDDEQRQGIGFDLGRDIDNLLN